SIRLAEEGFPVSFWLSESLKGARDLLARFDESRRIFLRNGNLYQPGEIFKQPELGATLRLIAQHGPAAFYTGPTAKAIAATIEKYHGIISLGDLEQYQAKLRNPLIGQFRGYRIISVPPPRSGGACGRSGALRVFPDHALFGGRHRRECGVKHLHLERRLRQRCDGRRGRLPAERPDG